MTMPYPTSPNDPGQPLPPPIHEPKPQRIHEPIPAEPVHPDLPEQPTPDAPDELPGGPHKTPSSSA